MPDPTPLDVVLTPPQQARLQSVLGRSDLSGVRLSAEGWHRFAVLADDTVLLLPRSHRWVPGLEREAAALTLLEQHGVAAPRLLDRLDDEELWPYPVTVLTRYRADSWAAHQRQADRSGWQRMLAQLAELIADCHRIETSAVPDILGSATPTSPDPLERELRHFEDYLRPGSLERLGRTLAGIAGLPPSRVDRWMKIIEPCLELSPTFTHRDINEGQIMINSAGRVCGLIDWESAGVQHPLSDFDFGEWGFGIWDWEPEFAVLRKSFWDSYVAARGIALPDWLPVQLLMTIIGTPPPEGHTTAWTASRRARTIANIRTADALI